MLLHSGYDSQSGGLRRHGEKQCRQNRETSRPKRVQRRPRKVRPHQKKHLGEYTEQAASEKASGGNAPGRVVKWNCGTSGSRATIAEEKGYLKDEGITIEYVEANANADAMTLLATGRWMLYRMQETTTLCSRLRPSGPDNLWSHMVMKGCMPVVAKSRCWSGTESNFIGKGGGESRKLLCVYGRSDVDAQLLRPWTGKFIPDNDDGGRNPRGCRICAYGDQNLAVRR